ncbi:MAG: hypothetical protein ACJA1A_001718 [Saprospiraceae bacterium]|jgi:hypothetical protein
MKKYLALMFILISSFGFSQTSIKDTKEVDYVDLSVNLIDDQKMDKDVTSIIETLRNSTADGLNAQLTDDKKKLAFWVNIYNGYIQYILSKNPELYEDRRNFFSMERIDIAGKTLSFASIEHGIIRHSQFQFFMGYLTNPFPSSFEKMLRVEERDWRIHFALNCGAKSCPPVATYHPETLDYEFDYMTKEYLKEQTVYGSGEKLANTVTLFSWFRGDFGGPDGIRDILVDYDVVSERPKRVKLTSYDWTLDLGNYREIPDQRL